MAFANINGAVIHYRDEGPRNGQPLIFINSLGTDFRIWDEPAPDFVSRNRVVRYDKRGHGLSGLPPDCWMGWVSARPLSSVYRSAG